MIPQEQTPAREGDRLPGLMVRYQSGDAGAVDELVRLLSPRLYRFLAAGTNAPQDTEDVFQDCWIRIHRARHTWRPGEPLLPWIYAVARHTKLDSWRRRQARNSREFPVDTLPEMAAPDAMPAGEDGRLELLLGALPESQREVILMLKVSGMSLEEVARATSSTVGSIKQKAHRAYATLRKHWTKEGELPCPAK